MCSLKLPTSPHPCTALPFTPLRPSLTIFRMAALEWLAAVEMSSRDPAGGGTKSPWAQSGSAHLQEKLTPGLWVAAPVGRACSHTQPF